MAADGDDTASLSLEAAQHRRGPLLELLLAPMMSDLTFAEVVECVLAENRHRVESSLDDLWGCHAQLQGELNDLIDSHKRESFKSSQKRIKKEIDLRRKDLNSLSVAISQHKSSLARGQTNWRKPPPVMMVPLIMVPGMLKRPRWLLPQWLTMLHQ